MSGRDGSVTPAYDAWYREEWGRVWTLCAADRAIEDATRYAAMALTAPYTIEAVVVTAGVVPTMGKFPFHWRASRVRRRTTLDSRVT